MRFYSEVDDLEEAQDENPELYEHKVSEFLDYLESYVEQRGLSEKWVDHTEQNLRYGLFDTVKQGLDKILEPEHTR